MIVADTNVVSELMRPSPSPALRDWVGRQAAGELYTTAITAAEIRYGLERLPGGRRKYCLLAAADEVLAVFSEHVLPFDAAPPSTTRESRRIATRLSSRSGGSTPRS